MIGDQRQGVFEPVHAVLDLLDRARAAWAALDDAGLRAEITIEATALDGIEQAGRDPMQAQAARRLAALLLFAIERGTAPGGVL